jgi:formate dehydrogenase subunit gamma
MQQGHAGATKLFWFDEFGWLLVMVVFAALLASAYTYRKKPRCEGGRILRHDVPARVSHWFNAAGIVILIISAFGLGFLFFPRQVAYTDGAQAMFNLHFFGAVLFLFGAVYWVGNSFLYPRRLEEHAPYRGSLKDAVLHYLHLMGLTKKEGSPTGKYEASERLAFVPLTLLALFMALTGFVKLAARLWELPEWLVVGANWTHDWSTLLLVILLVFHVVLAALVPWAWPLLRSMIDGYIDVDFVKSHHPGWYRELQEEGLCPLDGKKPKEGADDA